MKVLYYLGNVLQIGLFSSAIVTFYSITPDGQLIYRLSPFVIYMGVSVLLCGPFILPKIKQLTRHWYLSAQAKRNYFHFRETVHQSPYLYDPVKFSAEPQDIGKSEELQNLCAYVVLVLIVSLFSPFLCGLWLLITGVRRMIVGRI